MRFALIVALGLAFGPLDGGKRGRADFGGMCVRN